MTIEIAESNFKAIERTIEKIESISCCKFIINENNKIEELHIISNGKRRPKQISRDVQSVLIASYCLNLDYKKISIAEISELSIKEAKAKLRIKSIVQENDENRTSIKVTLSDSKDVHETSISGINTIRNIEKMIVEATLKNIELFYGYEDKFIFEDIRTVQLSTDKVVVVIIINLEKGKEKRITGSAIIECDFKDAIARATLNAVSIVN